MHQSKNVDAWLKDAIKYSVYIASSGMRKMINVLPKNYLPKYLQDFASVQIVVNLLKKRVHAIIFLAAVENIFATIVALVHLTQVTNAMII